MRAHLAPEALEEARHALDAGLAPLQRLLRRCGEHREQPHGVGAVSVHHGLRVDAVVLRLGHLLDAADLHRVTIRTEHGAGDAAALVALHVDLGRIDPVLRAVGVVAIERLGNHHALAQQVLRRLVAAEHAGVAHQLVIQAEVQQVHDRVFDAADVLVDRQPVVGARVDLRRRTGAGVARVVQLDSMKVSKVSVSRSAGRRTAGRVVWRTRDRPLIGDCTPLNATSSGSSTGSWSSGTGTSPQWAQRITGIGQPQ